MHSVTGRRTNERMDRQTDHVMMPTASVKGSDQMSRGILEIFFKNGSKSLCDAASRSHWNVSTCWTRRMERASREHTRQPRLRSF